MAFYGKTNKLILMSLIASVGFQRLVFASNTFGLYQSNLEMLFASNACLIHWFGKSVFASVSFNMGPYTVSWPHTNDHNLVSCGGHLVLWDLGLIIHFPPGSTILIPSALLTHSNIPISSNEIRYSIIQYSSAGLFRWVYNSFKSDKEFMENSRWGNGLGMFSLWDDILLDTL
ncbi:hypothetical protein BT96DRAFT_967126 [Gymnopus androsaceus JB14]|uniref:Uncharacterized protein n=1 Tax=Gymnopus androsaceus JB14 TaxID=1447944 RepID=A0A6A4H6A9_9AGAR|nr:hypothetical protein BT96DRAFT_967126 [Gymnopus androsaceus JB14]